MKIVSTLSMFTSVYAKVVAVRKLDKTLTASQFIILVSSGFSILSVLLVSINIAIDPYGLFRRTEGRQLPVYHNERVSKYLLSYRYIPENFHGILIGPSLSANIDVSQLNTSMQFYNASVMGANISELQPIIAKCIEGNIKTIILCLDPYLVKTSGSKEIELNRKLLFGALGSRLLYETYAVALVRDYEIFPSNFPKNQIDAFGVNHYEQFFAVEDVTSQIEKIARALDQSSIAIDPMATRELKSVINLCRKNDVKLIGYFHPVPQLIFESKQKEYHIFQEEVEHLFGKETLINFNSPEYSTITSVDSNYIDHGHLSESGKSAVVNVLKKYL